MRIHSTILLCSTLIAVVFLTMSGCGSGDSTKKTTGKKTTSSTAAKESSPTSPGETTKTAASDIKPGWGNLKGMFIYDGDPPERPKLSITKDQQFCGKFDVRDETLVVNKENRGLANVVVSLYLSRGEKAPPLHDSFANAPNKVVLDNKGCRFSPHVCVVTTSQRLEIRNSDEVGHNTKIDTLNSPSNESIPVGGLIEKKFKRAERQPAPVNCSIHAWMRGHLIVRDDPYFAVTDENGQFEIKNLPAGEWTFQVWHEKARIGAVTVNEKPAQWSRGRVKLTINGDETTDLGEVKISPDQFK